MDTDRRNSERHELWFPVRISTGTASADAVCCDISKGGMQLVVSKPVAPGASLGLRFQVPQSPHPEHRRGRVVRVSENVGVDGLQWPQRIGVVFE